MGRFKEWIKKVIVFMNIKKEADVADAFEPVKQTMAVILENVNDTDTAAALQEILGGETPDFDIVATSKYESPPATTSPKYTLESMPTYDWEDLRKKAWRIIHWKQVITDAMATVGIVTELLSLGQIDQWLGALNVIIGNTGLTGLGGDLHAIENRTKTQELFEQSCLRLYMPKIPRERDLIYMYRQNLIPKKTFFETMRRLGFNPLWSFAMKEAAKRFPSPSELLTLLRRGIINEKKTQELLEHMGYSSSGAEYYLALKQPMHTTSALIQQVVKEVITPKQFIESMALQGWTKEEAQKYWDVHWRLVSLDDLMDMRNRGLIDNEKFGEMLIRHDYHPDWIEHLTTISYKNPTLRQFRQIMEYTDITDDEIDYALQTFGFAPAWEPVMRKFLTSRRLTNERTRMINELETNFIKGYLDEPDFRSQLLGMGLSADVVDLRIERSQLRYSREIKDDMKGIFINAYRNDFIDMQQLWQELIGLGIQGEIANIILDQEMVRKKPAAS